MFVPSCNSNTTFDGSHSLLISIKTTTHCNHGKYPKKRRQQQSVSHRRVAEKMCPRVSSHWWLSRLRCVPPLQQCRLVCRWSFRGRRLHRRCLLHRSRCLCCRRLLRSRKASFLKTSTIARRNKKNNPKLAAYDIDWLDSSATINECLIFPPHQETPKHPRRETQLPPQ
jgi:hypothetical protein